jgi:hypothetical protein
LERVDLLQNEISKLTAKEAISQIRAWVRAKGGSEVSASARLSAVSQPPRGCRPR